MEDPVAMLVGDDPTPVGVGDEDVVELADEPWRGGRRWFRERPVGEVEELVALLVGERAQQRPQAVERRSQPGQARPRRGVADCSGSKGGEVAQDEVVGIS